MVTALTKETYLKVLLFELRLVVTIFTDFSFHENRHFLVLCFTVLLLCSLTSKEVNLTEWPLNCQLKCYMKSRLMLLGLIMKFLLSAITMRPTYMTIIPSGPNLMVEFKTFGRWLVYFITQQSDQLYQSNMVWISRCRAIYYN